MEITFGLVGGYILCGIFGVGTGCAYLYYRASQVYKRDVALKCLELLKEGYTKEEIKEILEHVNNNS